MLSPRGARPSASPTTPLHRAPLQVIFNGVGITNVLYTAWEDTAPIRKIPLLVDAFLRDDLARVAPFVGDYLVSSQGTGPPGAVLNAAGYVTARRRLTVSSNTRARFILDRSAPTG